MRISCTNTTAENKVYMPPALGNGDLSFQIDYEGKMAQHPYTSKLGMNIYPGIRRAGFRYDSKYHHLIPFGWFEQELNGAGALIAWKQILDTEKAFTECSCQYENGLSVKTRIFCHLTRNIIGIRKAFSRPTDFSFRHEIGNPFRMALRREGKRLFYNVDEGQFEGVIGFWSDALSGNGGALSGRVTACDIFLAFDEENIACAEELGFDALFAGHVAEWAKYWGEAELQIPERKIQEVYETAQYHLRISSTRWSIPTGIFDAHWHARFFGFDEYFAFRGMLSSGHLSTAKKVPEFRHSILDVALQRASRYSPEVNNGAAKYSWETLEDGHEGAPAGMWIDHIFHMAHIAQECRDYVLFSGDREFLREKGYPVMKACALFFSRMSLERRPDGSIVLGHCTDLERLGAGVVNAFMTTCGAIVTLESAAQAAESLGLDAEFAASWRKDAAGLRATLPKDGEKYLPYPGCRQKSIAVFSGTYPYSVLEADDPFQKRALEDYELNGSTFGNMYPCGSRLCAWYACWKAIVYARTGCGEKAWQLIRDTADDTGCFSEIYEIHELAHQPWFTTAEGVFVQAVNELFLQIAPEGTCRYLPAVPPEWKDYSLRLPVGNGRFTRIVCRNGNVIRE